MNNDYNPVQSEMPMRGLLYGSALVALVCALAVSCTVGCTSMPELPAFPAGAYEFVTNAVQRALVELPEEEEEPESAEPAASDAQEASPAAGGDGATLVFRYGGVKADPAEDGRCRISALRIGGDSMSFHWDSSIPGDWKRKDGEKGPMILACAFYRDGDKWIGGKFDWIDEKRSSRSFENIRDGYGGWDAGAFFGAPQRAFCVVSADGKLRSNLEVAQ